MNKIDLHIHSTYSDGLLNPKDLLELCTRQGLEYISITDHDNLGAYNEIEKFKSQVPINIIPGVEISTFHSGDDIHILAYHLDPFNKKMRTMLTHIRKERINRAKKIIKKFKKFDIHISLKRLFELAGDSQIIARPHVARAVVEAGYCTTTREVFDKYLADDGPAYVPKIVLSPEEAIKSIAKHGGISILAHPSKLSKQSIVKDIISMGVDGLEAYYIKHTHNEKTNYIKIAKENNLITTGGSDLHGTNFNQNEYNYFNVPLSCIKELEEKKNEKN